MILKKNLNHFENKINFKFKDKNNLIDALLHPSYLKNKRDNIKNNENNFERLEFLGDRVLGLIVSNLIYKKFKNYNEGNLTKKLSYLVQKKFLYKIALEIGIDNILKYSYKKENKRMNESILSDSVESLIGSIFIDSGYLASLKFITSIWSPYLDIVASNTQDPKTNLQEISQKKSKQLPIYSLLKKDGPSHSPIFTVTLKVLKLNLIKGSGNSKREAEMHAAIKILKIINKNEQ